VKTLPLFGSVIVIIIVVALLSLISGRISPDAQSMGLGLLFGIAGVSLGLYAPRPSHLQRRDQTVVLIVSPSQLDGELEMITPVALLEE
jgi:hypothetical protein